ncbi:hypothetical protein QOT17_001785 [Balamuthia mandrillaris]
MEPTHDTAPPVPPIPATVPVGGAAATRTTSTTTTTTTSRRGTLPPTPPSDSAARGVLPEYEDYADWRHWRELIDDFTNLEWKREVVADLLRLYMLQEDPTRRLLSHFSPDVVFEDPISRCEGIREVRGRFNVMATMFKQPSLRVIGVHYKLGSIEVDIQAKYVLAVGRTEVHHRTLLDVYVDEEHKMVIKVQDRWDHSTLPKEEQPRGRLFGHVNPVTSIRNGFRRATGYIIGSLAAPTGYLSKRRKPTHEQPVVG